MALATFDQIKDFLELKKATVTEYPTLGILIDMLQTAFESYTYREFNLEERTTVFRITDVDGESSFWLKGTPIVSITSITATDTSGEDTSLELNDDYFFDTERVQLLSEQPEGSIVTIVYIGGLVDQTSDVTLVATIPTDLNFAMIQQISFQYQNRANIAATRVAIDTNSKSLPALNLLKYTTDILDRYKNLGTGF